MTDDQPPMAEAPEPAFGRQQMLATGGGSMSGNACRCSTWPAKLRLVDANQAIKNGQVALEEISEFRKALRSDACPHASIELDAFRKILWDFAYRPIWGLKQTLAAAGVDRLAREFRFSPGDRPSELSDLMVSFLDQAVGKLPPGRNGDMRVAYDPTRPGKEGNRPSLWSFVVSRTRLKAIKLFQQQLVNVPSEDLTDHAAPPAMQTPRSGESELYVAVLHRAVHASGVLLQMAKSFEDRLLSLLQEEVDTALVTAFQRRNLTKALRIARRGVNGDPGHCVVLDCRIGADSDTPPVVLGTTLTAEVARNEYASRNAKVLRDQAEGWLSDTIKLVVDGEHRMLEVHRLVRRSLEFRKEAFDMLDAIAPNVAVLTARDHVDTPGVREKIEKWRAKPRRFSEDDARGGVAINGVGIGNIPFLCGLLDPADEAVRSLAVSASLTGGR